MELTGERLKEDELYSWWLVWFQQTQFDLQEREEYANIFKKHHLQPYQRHYLLNDQKILSQLVKDVGDQMVIKSSLQKEINNNQIVQSIPTRNPSQKRFHNKTKIITVIDETRNKDPKVTGIVWLRKQIQTINFTFIVIFWEIFIIYYKDNQHQENIQDESIKEKFRPSKSAFLDISEEIIDTYGFQIPSSFLSKHKCIKTYKDWWSDEGLKVIKRFCKTRLRKKVKKEHYSEIPEHSNIQNEMVQGGTLLTQEPPCIQSTSYVQTSVSPIPVQGLQPHIQTIQTQNIPPPTQLSPQGQYQRTSVQIQTQTQMSTVQTQIPTHIQSQLHMSPIQSHSQPPTHTYIQPHMSSIQSQPPTHTYIQPHMSSIQLQPQHPTLQPQHPILQPQHPTLQPQHPTLQPQHPTLQPQQLQPLHMSPIQSQTQNPTPMPPTQVQTYVQTPWLSLGLPLVSPYTPQPPLHGQQYEYVSTQTYATNVSGVNPLLN